MRADDCVACADNCDHNHECGKCWQCDHNLEPHLNPSQDWVALMSKPIALFSNWKNYFGLKITSFLKKNILVKKMFGQKKD